MEAAIVLPLTIFLILGSLQFFLILQGRVMAEYAAFRATRVGVTQRNACTPMLHAAIGALLPTFTRVDTPALLGARFRDFRTNRYADGPIRGFDGDIVWIDRNNPTWNDSGPNWSAGAANAQRLETRLVFWYPMRIPFADWIISRMMLAHFGLQDITGANPLMLTQKAPTWMGEGSLGAGLTTEYQGRAGSGEYVFPIEATHTMRMMTPNENAGGRCR